MQEKTIQFIKILLCSALITGLILPVGVADEGRGHNHSEEGPQVELLEPRSLPYALQAWTGENEVVFSVQAVGNESAFPDKVILRELGLFCDNENPEEQYEYYESYRYRNEHVLNDEGRDGDQYAGDGVYSATIVINTDELDSNACIRYKATAYVGDFEQINSTEYWLCSTQFSTEVAESDTSGNNQIQLPNSDATAVANELLVRFENGVKDYKIDELASVVGATVVGTILPRGVYQFQFADPLTLNELLEIIEFLNNADGVESAYVNSIGEYTFTPNDPEFGNQHGLQLIRADDAWDAGATGAGVTVTVLDSGVSAHADLSGVTGAGNDAINHGTGMAGIIGATTDNALGVAGVAYDATINRRTVSADAAVTIAEMVAGFTAVAGDPASGEVVNASFNIESAPPPVDFPVDDQFDLCAAINDVVLNGATPVKVVVSSAGNDNINGNHYPARCNDATHPSHANLTNKSLFITVLASTSCNSGCTVDQKYSTSNFGPWIDVAAPGQNIRTLNNAGGYEYASGTSAAAAVVSGAAAQLLSCGVAINQIESTLQAGTLPTVSFTGGSTERIDVIEALSASNVAPTAVNISASAIDENVDTTGGVSIGTLTTVDANTCDTATYSINGGADAASFSIGGAGNDELVLDDGVLDFETQSAYNVTVRVTDVGGLTFDQPIVVTVNDLNEAPISGNQVFNIDENEPNATVVGTVAATEPDGDTMMFSITGGNTGGTFAINGTSGEITVANSPTLDFETNPVFNLIVTVSDGVLSATPTVTINVNDLPDTVLGFPTPIIDWRTPVPFENYIDAFGDPFTRYRFEVTNRADYDPALFAPTAAYGPCGLNNTPSQTWVDIYNGATDARIYGFCALGTPDNLFNIWFAIPQGSTPPPSIYITLTDRAGPTVVTSNILAVP